MVQAFLSIIAFLFFAGLAVAGLCVIALIVRGFALGVWTIFDPAERKLRREQEQQAQEALALVVHDFSYWIGWFVGWLRKISSRTFAR